MGVSMHTKPKGFEPLLNLETPKDWFDADGPNSPIRQAPVDEYW